MIRHFFAILIRTSLKNGSYTIVNVAGLVLGMTSFALITLYVWHERSYDQFLDNNNQIFRVRQDRYSNGALDRQWAGGPMGIGADLKNNFPEVQRFVCIHRGLNEYHVIASEEKLFREDHILFASEEFFKIFSFSLVKGVDSLVLRNPFTMVISESFAKKYFGNADPIGKILKCNGKDEYAITGVFRDVPENSHLQFDALFSFESLFQILGKEETNELLSNWGWVGTYTYIQLNSNAEADALQKKLPDFVDKKMGATLREWNEGMAFVLQPIESIHLDSNTPDELNAGGNRQTTGFLTIISVFILILAWINYINLATAKSLERAKEVGVRKVLGSSRSQLMRQFLFESLIYNLVALVITALIVGLLLPSFSKLVGRNLDASALLTTKMSLFIALMMILGAFLSGVYPAISMSGFLPVKVLKGKLHGSFATVYLRRGLVTFQFVASIVLIIGALVVFKQIAFMRTSPTGINLEQVLVINGPTTTDSSYLSKVTILGESLLQYPGIKSFTVSSDVPGHHVRNTSGNVRVVGEDVSKGNSYEAIMADENFIKTYNLSLIAGNNFSGNLKDQWRTAMVNEAAMKLLGFTEPGKILGQKIYLWGDTPEIIGVIKNYHQESFKQHVGPLVLVYDAEATNFYSVKFKSHGSVNNVIEVVEAKYRQVFPDFPFQFFFLKDHYNEQYKSDQQFGMIVLLFTILSITIACIGLLGLSSYIVAQRTKEISIRRILGATVRQLLVLVSRDFVITIVLANVIAWPLVYMIASEWLTQFAYRTQLNVIDFILPGFAVLVIATLTIFTQSIKASHRNPVRNLRSE